MKKSIKVLVIVLIVLAILLIIGGILFTTGILPNIFVDGGIAPMTVFELLDLGERYLLDLNFEQALLQFQRVIDIEPMNPRGYTGAAEAYIGLGEYRRAENILRQGLRLLPDDMEIQSALIAMGVSIEIEGETAGQDSLETGDEVYPGEDLSQPTDSVQGEDITPQPQPQPQPLPGVPVGNVSGIIPGSTAVRIGVSRAGSDDVGRIIANIGAGIDFDLLTIADFNSFERLNQFDAIFINCGGHGDVNAYVLRQFVEEGGLVYASDLASHSVLQAFPGMFTVSSAHAQTVQNASIVHTSLASHMGRNNINVVFDIGGWHVIGNLRSDATVYIQGNVQGHGSRPLAFSVDVGRGTVFFTSFHNHMQATSDMVNFIEYLVFRIQHVEAERNLVSMATEAGYIFDGSVFGMLNAHETSEAFYYTPQANDFMLLFDPAMGDFTILLSDPHGLQFSTEDIGILTDVDIDPADIHLAFEGFPIELITNEMVVESLGRQGFRVLNPTSGEWSFSVTSNNEAPDMMFAVGLAERPVAALTRAMFTQVLANFESRDLAAFSNVAPTFFDVQSLDWFFEAVEWAARNGVVEGVGEGYFAPNSPLTREQMITMLYRYLDFRGAVLPVLRTGEFSDQSEISYWAIDAVVGLYQAGIIGGRPDRSFSPQVTATTTDIAHVFSNVLPFLVDLPENEGAVEYEIASGYEDSADQAQQQADGNEALDENEVEDFDGAGDIGEPETKAVGRDMMDLLPGVILVVIGISLLIAIIVLIRATRKRQRKSSPPEIVHRPTVGEERTQLLQTPTGHGEATELIQTPKQNNTSDKAYIEPTRNPSISSPNEQVRVNNIVLPTNTEKSDVMQKSFCENCGKETRSGATFCHKCGNKINN